MSEQLFFNGINATTGEPLLPPITEDLLASIITREERNAQQEMELKWWWENFVNQKKLAAVEGTDYGDLSSAGWGVIFPFDVDENIVDALQPLLEWRKEQAGKLYKEYTGLEGYQYKLTDGTFETKNDWLTRHGMAPGPAVPEKVPYYLLLVGDPDTIPYHFQIQLDVQYAVGRIYFDTPEEYANYANSVISAEKEKLTLGKNATFFGVANPDDRATNMSIDQLVKPLAETMPQKSEGWMIESVLKDQATKANLGGVLSREQAPALLFTASHGMGFPNGHELQLSDQGALLCQDWPGPNQWRKPIGKEFYFAADDLTKDANVHGLVAFVFACYGAGTPQMDEFSRIAFKRREAIASRNFISKLPQRLLSHPKGGALAFIGHIERAWGYSFNWGRAGVQLAVFEGALKRLMDGFPVGYAFEYFNERYAELSSDLNYTLDQMEFGLRVDAMELAGMWTANNDARNYVVLGDPFVKLMV